MYIEDIVATFIKDLKSTKEYKEAWKKCYETKEIVFNFRDKKFYNHDEAMKNIEIVMDEQVLLGR